MTESLIFSATVATNALPVIQQIRASGVEPFRWRGAGVDGSRD
jgi:hypothetical protein